MSSTRGLVRSSIARGYLFVLSVRMVWSTTSFVSYKAYNAYTDYVNVILHGNILAVRQHNLPYGGMSAIAVGYAATPFCLSYFFLNVIFFDAFSASICKTSFQFIVCWKIFFISLFQFLFSNLSTNNWKSTQLVKSSQVLLVCFLFLNRIMYWNITWHKLSPFIRLFSKCKKGLMADYYPSPPFGWVVNLLFPAH